MAPITRTAFSMASRVRIVDSRTSLRAMSTMLRPVSCASVRRRESIAGMVAL